MLREFKGKSGTVTKERALENNKKPLFTWSAEAVGQRCSEIAVLKDSTILFGKYTWWNPFYNKDASLKSAKPVVFQKKKLRQDVLLDILLTPSLCFFYFLSIIFLLSHFPDS